MAKAKTLDEFLNLWENYEGIKRDVSAFSQDPLNPGIYTRAIARQADMLGVKPDVIQTDPATGQKIVYSPAQIRAFLEGENGKSGQIAYTQQTAHEFAEKNLGSVVREIPQDKIEKMLRFNLPKKTGNKAHDEAASLHEAYLNLSNLVEAYHAERKELFPTLLDNSKAAAIDLLREKYGEAEVKKAIEEGNTPLIHIINSAIYTVMTNPGIAAGIILEVAKRKYKALTEKIKGNAAKYIAENLKSSEPGEKEYFYEGMFKTLAKKE